jgi:hypothetical protein
LRLLSWRCFGWGGLGTLGDLVHRYLDRRRGVFGRGRGGLQGGEDLFQAFAHLGETFWSVLGLPKQALQDQGLQAFSTNSASPGGGLRSTDPATQQVCHGVGAVGGGAFQEMVSHSPPGVEIHAGVVFQAFKLFWGLIEGRLLGRFEGKKEVR